ncbi:MAG: ChrR family anti-sigma-E factor [Pseudomonadota bacterium]
MNIHHHLDDATIVAYAAGALPAPIALVVSAHLSFCPKCRARVRQAEAIGGVVMEEEAPVSLSAGCMNNMFERLEAETRTEATAPVLTLSEKVKEDSILPPQVRKALGIPFSDIKWKRVAKGVGMRAIDLGDEDEGKVYLMKIEAGRVLPEHGHGGSEVTLVLSGSYTDRYGTFGPGDIADLDDHEDHQPIVDDGADCICLVASETPAKFKGILPRLFQPVIGI